MFAQNIFKRFRLHFQQPTNFFGKNLFSLSLCRRHHEHYRLYSNNNSIFSSISKSPPRPQFSYFIVLNNYHHHHRQKQQSCNLTKLFYYSTFYSPKDIPFCDSKQKLKKLATSEMSTTNEIVTEELLKIFILDEGKDENTFIANHLGDGTWITKNVYGGALFAQSLVAAEKTVPKQFLPHSIHSLFILNVSTQFPVTYKIQRIRDGRSFCTRYVQAEQNGKIVYTTQISFHVKEESSISHQALMPVVKPPEECKAVWEMAQEYLAKAEKGELQLSEHSKRDLQAKYSDRNSSIVEMRPVNPDIQLSIIPHNHQPFYYWCRVRIPISNDRNQHRALAAYITDATLVTTANRPHISQGYTPSMLVSLDNNAWFHTDDFRVDEWMLYENESPVAKHARAFSTGRLWTRDGQLILSVAQESLSRTKLQPSHL